MSAPLAGLENLFGGLLTASWQASVLALLVLGLQAALGARLNPRWRYALWLLVLVRLLLPFQVESALSLFQFAPAPPAALAAPMTQALFPAAPVTAAPVPEIFVAAPPTPFSLFSIIALGWLAGVGVLGALTFEINRRFARHVAASPEVTDPAILALFAAAKAELHTRRAIRLVESAQVGSPAIMGLFRPTLLLPARVRETFDLAELRLIFLHELAHLKRGDVIAQGLIALLQIVHWFNPVLWFAFRRMRADREPAADALVLSRAGEGEKERYGLMLLKLLEHFQQRHALPTLVGILEDKDKFKRRFQLIARYTRGAYGWSALGVLLIGILSIACLTRPKATVPTAVVEMTRESNKATGFIQVDAKVAQIGEGDYQAHRSEIDAAVQKGDIEPLSNLRSFNLLSEPTSLSKPGERTVMEAIRVFPYPVAWDPPETVSDNKNPPKIIPATPTDFKRQNLGVRFVSTPTLGADEISFVGYLEVTSLEGWSQGKYNTHQPRFHVRRLLLSESLAFGQTKGFQVPGGAQMEPSDPTTVYSWDQVSGETEKHKTLARLFLFLNMAVSHATPPSTDSPLPEKKTQPIIDAVKKAPDQTTLESFPLNVDQAANNLLENRPMRAPPAKGPGVTVVGFLHEPNQVDFSRSSGRLTSPDGLGYEYRFEPDGSFVIPHVQPGPYNRSLHLFNKNPAALPSNFINRDLTPITVDDVHAMTMNISLGDPFDKPLPGSVQIAFKLVEVSDDAYQANHEKMEAAMKAGGPGIFQLLNKMKGVDLLSAPSVTTQFDQTANIDIVREFPYPTSFGSDKNGKLVPKDFKTADIGIKSNIIAARQNGEILLNCDLSVTDFDGFTASNVGAQVPTLRTVETRLVEAVPATGEPKGVWIPGGRLDEETITDKDGSGKTSVSHQNVKKRLLLFVSAKLEP